MKKYFLYLKRICAKLWYYSVMKQSPINREINICMATENSFKSVILMPEEKDTGI